MAILFEIEHATTYKYKNPVTFGTHRAMFLPRRGPRGRLVSWSVKTNPASKVRWVSDALSNAVTVIEFSEPGKELTFTLEFRGIHFGAKQVEEFPLEPRAEMSGPTLSSICALMRRTPMAVLPPGPRASRPTIGGERPTFYDGCWTCSATPSTTMPGKRKVLSLPVKPCARSQVPAGTMRG